MKNIFKIILSIALVLSFQFSGYSQKKSKNQKSFLVVSYNVENLYDTIDNPDVDDAEFLPTAKSQWNQTRYNKKQSDLAKVLSSIDIAQLPDLIGLVEIENKGVLVDLANQTTLKSGNYGIAHQDSPDLRGIDVALLYNKSSFNFISQTIIPVTMPEEKDLKTRDILYVKGIALNLDTVHVFVNHWPSRRAGKEDSEAKRVAAAKILRAEVDKILKMNKKAKVIIIGDFNDEPIDKSLNSELRATNNKNPKDLTELYNLMYDKKLNKEGTLSYKGEWNMLDNIVVSRGLLSSKKGLSTTFISGQIFSPDWLLFSNPKTNEKSPSKTYGGTNYFGGYSDHLPVYFYLTKK